ncbi:glycosyltransferase [Bacillus sp. SL00103]
MIVKVSVILTSYNKPDFIDHCAKGSMMEQTCSNWELLIMDDGSEQDTIEKIRPI